MRTLMVPSFAMSAVVICEKRGARPDLAISFFHYSELLHDKGDLEKAGDYLQRATELFNEMGMTWWAEQAGRLRESLPLN